MDLWGLNLALYGVLGICIWAVFLGYSSPPKQGAFYGFAHIE